MRGIFSTLWFACVHVLYMCRLPNVEGVTMMAEGPQKPKCLGLKLQDLGPLWLAAPL